MKFSKRLITVTSVLGLVVLASACTKDRNLDDYKNDQLQEDEAKLAQANGVWSGIAISEQDNKSPLGAMQLTLQATTQQANSTDSSKAYGQPVLITNVDFLGAQSERMSIAAQNAYYEPTSGVYQAQIPVTRMINGVSIVQTVSINAILNNGSGVMDGTVEAQGFPGFGGRFHLVRGGASLDALATQAAPTVNPVFEKTNFTGPITFKNVVDGTVVKNVNLNIIKPPSTAEEDFLTVLVPQTPVIADLNFGDSAQIEFSTAIWDHRTGKLTGTANLQQGAVSSGSTSTGSTSSSSSSTTAPSAPQTVVLSLDCSTNTGNQGFRCSLGTTSNTGSATADLAPNPSNTVDPVDNGVTRKAIVHTYKGTAVINQLDPNNPGAAKPITHNIAFTVIYSALTRIQEVTELLSPTTERYLLASFAIVGSGIGDNFPVAKWDMNNKTLDAYATFSTPAGVSGNSSLNCTNFTFQDPATTKYNFTCTYLSTLVSTDVPIVVHN